MINTVTHKRQQEIDDMYQYLIHCPGKFIQSQIDCYPELLAHPYIGNLLFVFIVNNSQSAFIQFLDCGVDCNIIHNGKYLLEVAINVKIDPIWFTCCLIEHGARWDIIPEKCREQIVCAVMSRSTLDNIARLVPLVDLNQPNLGEYPLDQARNAIQAYKKTKYLLESGISPNIRVQCTSQFRRPIVRFTDTNLAVRISYIQHGAIDIHGEVTHSLVDQGMFECIITALYNIHL